MRKIIGVTAIVAIFFIGWMVGASETSVSSPDRSGSARYVALALPLRDCDRHRQLQSRGPVHPLGSMHRGNVALLRRHRRYRKLVCGRAELRWIQSSTSSNWLQPL